MKRVLAIAAVISLAISIIPNSYAAAPKSGSTCTKAGATSTYAGKKYTCIKSGKKLVWNKGVALPLPTPTPTTNPNPLTAAAISCPVDGKCEIGNTGPGGGIVFYLADTPQPWGQYLEAAPANWNNTNTDPPAQWCDLTSVFLMSKVSNPELIGQAVGTGKANTQLMTAFCKSGAGHLVSAYRGGGKADWFLPSRDEVSQIYINRKIIGGDFAPTLYWSSSERDAFFAWSQNFGNGGQYYNVKSGTLYVRPVRAF